MLRGEGKYEANAREIKTKVERKGWKYKRRRKKNVKLLT